MAGGIALVVRRRIKAPAETLFRAWTEPAQLVAWWGPRPVKCSHAEVELRTGGRYVLVHELPDGGTITIHGEFLVVDAPHKLVYTWLSDEGAAEKSLVTVRFEPHGDTTEIVIVHQDIPDEAARDSHEKGWLGCLDSLEGHVQRPEGPVSTPR